MTARTRLPFALLVLLVLCAVTGLAQRQAAAPAAHVAGSAAAAALTDLLPLDPLITAGTFPNGVRYLIRTNKRPENRAELRLVVDAGSVLEDQDQLGLAHMVEHMAFNGTTHFAKQEIVSFMESIGMRFGPSVNASTGFDETVYKLEVPTDNPEVLEKSFLILEDWAHNLSFDPKEIDKERGVIIEEWRLRRGAAARMQDQQLPILVKGSRYAERLPIGTTKSIETFSHSRLRRFYQDWYRPDLMTLIAVGDFNMSAVEALARKHFASIPAAKTRRPRPAFPVPDHPDTLFAIATDKEATMTSVAVYDKRPPRDERTVGAYRQQIVEQLYSGMLNRRFSELTQKPDPPFLAGGSARGRFVRTKDAATLNAVVKEDGIERGLDALFTEAARASRFGFTPTELDRQKRDTLRSLERAAAEKDKQESASLAAEYVRYATQGEPAPGIAFEYGLHQRFVPEITLAEITALGKNWMNTDGRNRVVVVSAPRKESLAVPDGPKLAAVMAGTTTKELAAYVDTAAGMTLMDAPPKPGAVVRVTDKPAFGITEWDLSNGVKVVLKPTTFKQDEVLLRATSPGGTSLVADSDYVAASSAAAVVGSGGLGRFNAIELRKVLAGKAASVRPVISELEEGLTGSASPKDLETLFQLIYLTFTQPRADPTIFGVLTAQMKTVLANQAASPAFAFNETLQTTIYQDHYRVRSMTAERVAEMSLEKSFAFYKDRFADASDFTFVFVGSFDLQAMKPLVEQYLGSLPSLGRKESWKDVGMTPVRGVVGKSVKKGIEPQSQVALAFSGRFPWNRDQRVAIRAMSSVLETRLRETLREDLSGTYGVRVSPSYGKIPNEQYVLNIGFGCSPARAAELTNVVLKEIEALKAGGPTAKQASDVREQLLRDFETNVKQNAYLLAQIWIRYQVPEDLAEFFTLSEFYKTVDAAMIQEAARRYLDTANYVQVTLLPEAAATTPSRRP
jgi:zinc protease